MFRALLAAVKPAAAHDHVTDFAMTLAARHGMAVEACLVVDIDRLAAPEPTPLGGAAFKSERDAQRIALARQHAGEAIGRLETAAQEKGVHCRAQVVDGDTVASLSLAVQRCDALVCGHTAGGDASERSLLYSILKHSPRPAIVVPSTPPAGQDVLVAYDGTAQAARALASFANSGLGIGRNVHVVSFGDVSGNAGRCAETARVFLSRHEISAHVHVSPLEKDVASQIRHEAARVSAGLVVMGAFGQGAVREFFFGSVTRAMLSELTTPVLLEH